MFSSNKGMAKSSFLVAFLGAFLIIAQCMGEVKGTSEEIEIPCYRIEDCIPTAQPVVDDALLGCMKDKDCVDRVACKGGATAVCGDHNICQCKPPKAAEITLKGKVLRCKRDVDCIGMRCLGGFLPALCRSDGFCVC